MRPPGAGARLRAAVAMAWLTEPTIAMSSGCGADQGGRGAARPFRPPGGVVARMEPGPALGQDARLAGEAHLVRQGAPGGGIQVADVIGHLELVALAGERVDGVHGPRRYRGSCPPETGRPLVSGVALQGSSFRPEPDIPVPGESGRPRLFNN